MTIYYHGPTGGFYDTRAHGERTMLVVDPTWTRPTINVQDPTWDSASAAPGTPAPTIKAFDEQAQAPLIEIANPDCYLPPEGELCELSLEEYQALFTAQAEGKFILTEDGRPVIADAVLTWESRRAGYTAAVQAVLDKAAVKAGYTDIRTAITYADEPAVPRFQAEGQAFRAWRSLVWAYCFEQFDLIENGDREPPASADFVAELPALELPDV